MSSRTRYAVGLDCGSARTRAVVLSMDDTRLRYLSSGEAPSRGWFKGRIADQKALAESIMAAVSQAEIRALVKDPQFAANGAVVGIGGLHVSGSNSRGVYEFGRPRQVEPNDMAYAVELASRVRLEEDRLVLQVFPQDFTLDGRAGYRYPRGAVCARLEAHVHVVTASVNDHQAVIGAVHQAHLAVEETVFEPVAAAYAAIQSDDRTRGVALVDIGREATNIVVYDGEAVVLATPLAVSGDHFTRDVAWGLCVTYEDAERLKVEYGCSMLGLTSDNTLIEVPSQEGRAPREAPRRQLNEILEARAEELFFYVREKIREANMEQQLLEGVMLAGGGALLNGMCDMAERMLNCQARNALAIGIREWPEELLDPSWTTAAGLAMYSARLKLQNEPKRKAPGFLGLVLR